MRARFDRVCPLAHPVAARYADPIPTGRREETLARAAGPPSLPVERGDARGPHSLFSYAESVGLCETRFDVIKEPG
jgi:hypothetical protein